MKSLILDRMGILYKLRFSNEHFQLVENNVYVCVRKFK